MKEKDKRYPIINKIYLQYISMYEARAKTLHFSGFLRLIGYKDDYELRTYYDKTLMEIWK